MERKIASFEQEATVNIGNATVILGINGKSGNPNRHAMTLTPEKARELAKLLVAAADFS